MGFLYIKQLNDTLRLNKVRPYDRPLLVSAVLLALKDNTFKHSYQQAGNLATLLIQTIERKLLANLAKYQVALILQQYQFIVHHSKLTSELLKRVIKDIDLNVNSQLKINPYHDILGEFYVRSQRVANQDKSLGIVLTPSHIADLLAELARVNKKSVVLDNCTGTGGLLLAAARKMLKNTGHIASNRIKIHQLIGIEQQPNMYSLAHTNMQIRELSNVFYGNCFDEAIISTIKDQLKPTAGILNPPYKACGDDISEYDFILNNLSMLEEGSYCVAIIPISCATAKNGQKLTLKKKLLDSHILDAVLSMPEELFINSNAWAITVVLVLKAHIPHPKDYPTYFGYWKDDGFSKRMPTGRQDYEGKWQGIMSKWLNNYQERKALMGLSVIKSVNPQDEWCVEAYMQTDYTKLTKLEFIKTLKRYIAHRILSDEIGSSK